MRARSISLIYIVRVDTSLKINILQTFKIKFLCVHGLQLLALLMAQVILSFVTSLPLLEKRL